MRTMRNIDYMASTMANFTLFAILLSVFILVFFFPEAAGILLGKIMNGFEQAFAGVKSELKH